MKIICDIPDEVIKSVRMGTWCGSSVVEKMIANGTPIPDNATNGEVIDLIFPYEKTIDEVWWIAPYQKGGKG